MIPVTTAKATEAAPRPPSDGDSAGTGTAMSKAAPATRAMGPGAASGFASRVNPALALSLGGSIYTGVPP